MSEEKRPSRRLLAWALANTFVVEDLVALVSAHAEHLSRENADEATAILLDAHGEPTDDQVTHVARVLADRALELQRLGREYWRPKIKELKAMHARGALLRLGTPVAELLKDRSAHRRKGR
ncbi:MAG TPA: hypothetical protein VFF73_09105 [Planctomycetota bacterium]|nr:hypothetical protein [Planctomycetota bacterium]